jgi:esterase/lipase
MEISAQNGTILNGDLYREISPAPKALVIFVHGFKGFKNWGGFPYLLTQISHAGFTAAAFNFSHNGVSNDKPEEFTRLDLFEKNTFSMELSELGIIIDHFYENAADYNIDKKRIALIGHSRGGGISILKASADERITCLVTLASVSNFDRYTDNLKIKWRIRGFIETENSRTKQIMKMNVSLLDDLENNKESLDICRAAEKIKIPSLIIHGKEDLSVRYTEAEQIYKHASRSPAELMIIENTGHTFGVIHPFSGTTPAFEKVILKVKEFLKVHL